MNQADYKAIAGIIHKRFIPSDIRFATQEYVSSTVIEDLADYMAADAAAERCNCPKHGFDRAAFVAACYGEKP